MSKLLLQLKKPSGAPGPYPEVQAAALSVIEAAKAYRELWRSWGSRSCLSLEIWSKTMRAQQALFEAVEALEAEEE